MLVRIEGDVDGEKQSAWIQTDDVRMPDVFQDVNLALDLGHLGWIFGRAIDVELAALAADFVPLDELHCHLLTPFSVNA